MAIHLSAKLAFSPIITLLLPLAIPAYAQQPAVPQPVDPAKPQITGRVMEFGTTLGVDGVEVTLEKYDAPATSSFVATHLVQKTLTNSEGRFRFFPEAPGDYRVSVKKEGYVAPQHSFASPNAVVSVAKETTKTDAHFVLARPAEVRGQVVDEESGKPVADISVSISPYRFVWGRLTLFSTFARTDANGNFAFTGLGPAEYILGVGPGMDGGTRLIRHPELKGKVEERILTVFSDGDLHKVDLDYGATYWPGGRDSATAIPITLSSGMQLDLGHLAVPRLPHYRARLHLADLDCGANDTLVFDVRDLSNRWLPTTIGRVPCVPDVLLRGFSSGDYQLEITRSGPGRPRKDGTLRMTVADDGLSAVVPFSRRATINGTVKLASGAAPLDLRKLAVLVRPIEGAASNIYESVDPQGKFQLKDVLIRDYQLLWTLPDTHYIQEVRYNGRTVPSDRLPVDEYSDAQLLDVVVADRGAALNGTVEAAGRPVPNPLVILIPDLPERQYTVSWLLPRTTTGSAEGAFQFTGLAPGNYRIAAVPKEAADNIQKPALFEELLRTAAAITLREGQLESIELKLLTPR